MNKRRKKIMYSNFHFFGDFSHFYLKVSFHWRRNPKTTTFLNVTVVRARHEEIY